MQNFPELRDDELRIRPLEQAETIPSRWYTDPQFYDMERDVLFLHSWQYAGAESQIPKPGDYTLATVAGNPLILVRSREGVVQAFYNVCRHRGGPLAIEPNGNVRVLQCKYHGWTYCLDGSLRGVPRFDRTELFDKKDYGLVPVEVRSWQGLLFVRLEGGAVEPEELMRGIPERIAPQQLGKLMFYRRDEYDIACNWKVYVDNYLEGYHIPLVHPELHKMLDYRAYTTETHEYYSLQYSPFRDQDGNNIYGAADGEAYYYFVFPNIMLNILPGRLQVNSVLPLQHGRCRVWFDYFYSDIISPEARHIITDDLKFSDEVQREDIEICEHVQRGLASRGYDRGRFSPECEQGVYHFQSMLKGALRKALGR